MANKFSSLVNKPIVKDVQFMDDTIQIRKLTVSQVLQIQEKAAAANGDQANSGFEMIKTVIKMSVVDAAEASDEDFKSFPMDELTRLSNEIMVFSGISGAEGK